MQLAQHPYVREFLERICSRILLRRKANEIYREYLAHIEDAVESSVRGGLTEDQAIVDAISRLGDPYELSVALNRVHRPLMRLPVLRGLASLLIVAATNVFIFQNHLGRLMSVAVFCPTVILGLFLVVVGSKKTASVAAWNSLFFSVEALSQTERSQALRFFHVLSRNIQSLSILVGLLSLLGIYLGIKDPSAIGRWVATGFLSYLYGFIFGVLLVGMHIKTLWAYRKTRRSAAETIIGKLQVLIQGLGPVLVIFGLINVFCHLDYPGRVVWGLAGSGCLFLVSAILIILIPAQRGGVHDSNSFWTARLKKMTPLYWTFPIYIVSSVGMVLMVI